MKAFILLLLLSMGAVAQKKITVALIDLTIGEGLPSNISQVLSNLVRQEFVKSEMFDILDRGNMESILKEQNFIMKN